MVFLVNFSALTCLYWGLVAPNRDFTYNLTARAVSTSPIISAYKALSRAIRALLAPVLAVITPVFFAFKSVSKVFKATNFNSFSFGRYFGSAVSVAIICAK